MGPGLLGPWVLGRKGGQAGSPCSYQATPPATSTGLQGTGSWDPMVALRHYALGLWVPPDG